MSALAWAKHSWRKKPISLSPEEWATYLADKIECSGHLRLAMGAARRAGIQLKVTVTWPNVTGPGDPEHVRVKDEQRSNKLVRR